MRVGLVAVACVLAGLVGCSTGSPSGGSTTPPATTQAATPTFSVAAGSYTSAQMVAITDATAGATVYYTTDGSVPSVSSTLYTTPVQVAVTETLSAVAFASGHSGSAVASAAYVINLAAAAPLFSVPTGTYTSVQTVALSDTTTGAQIYYTTNGTTPTTTSTLYSGPLTVNNSETVEAIAVASGYSPSAVASAAYVINLPPVANAGGPYAGVLNSVVSFNGSASSSPQSKTLTYAWDFGDGNTGSGVAPTHTYAVLGTYTVKLTVTDTSSLSNSATVQVVVPNGRAFASQQALAGAHVYLFAANTTGYGGMGLAASSTNASVSLLSAASTGQSDSLGVYVLTGADGSFFIAGDYSCTPGSQMYLYSLGGSTGSGTNLGIGLLAALGSCPNAGNFAATPYVVMNELSTIATAYAFAGFATDATHVGSSGTALAKVGIANAFANAANLETLASGAALATTPAGNGTVPQTAINMLANILASCTSTGAAGSNGCALLFGDALSGGSTGTTPTDTAAAAINIAHNPGVNVATLYALSSANSQFTPALTTQPNDFTVGLAFTGGGLTAPTSIAIDGSGNAWIVNVLANSISELSSAGAAISPSTGYTGGGLNKPYFIAIDGSGSAWVSNQGFDISKFSGAGNPLSPSTGYPTGGVGGFHTIAVDGTGAVWMASGSNVFKFSSAGILLSTSLDLTGGLVDPYSIAIDGSGNAWVSNQHALFGLSEFSNADIALSPPSGYTGGGLISDEAAIAIDGSGNAWVPNYRTSDSVSEFSNYGTALSPSTGYTGGGMREPTHVAIDGSGHVWVTNVAGHAVSELSSTGTALSPPSGYLVQALQSPFSIAVDGSGNVWLPDASVGRNVVIELVGVGTPVITPICAGLPATPTADGSSRLGTRP